MDKYSGLQPNQTLKEGKDFLRANLESGAKCPVCQRWAELKDRPLNSGQARFLIELFRRGGDKDFVHAPTILQDFKRTTASDYSQLKHWKLIEAAPSDDPDKRTSGMWKLTIPDGLLFVRGFKKVPAKVRIFNDVCLGYSGDEISIQQALGKHFSYEELMQGSPSNGSRADAQSTTSSSSPDEGEA